jgi:HlyD family secretion protein
MKRGFITTGLVVLVLVLAIVVFNRIVSEKKKAVLYTEVIQGDFEIAISTSGELRAENSVEIMGPEIAQRGDVRAQDLRIQDLVPEGSEVKEGDYVAQLDRSSFDNTLKDINDMVATQQKNLEMKLLDTAITLSALRDQVKNQRYIVDADSITLRNSQYEPPTTIRTAEINYDQSKRTLRQLEKLYSLRVAYTKFEVENLNFRIRRITRRRDDYQDILNSFTIRAPSPGMVIYKKDWRGNKRKTGSQISSFDRVVATIPDLKSMLSRIYVSEIDIYKVKVGQEATVTVDAFPKNTFRGKVATVANIGEKLPNTDSKVFEVLIKIDGTNPLLRPLMTTGNKVVLNTFNNVTYVPIECVQAGDDSIPYVYAKNKHKHVVLLGATNEKYVIIEKGIEPGEPLYLSTPEDSEKWKLTGLELIPVIKERERIKKEENQKYTREAEAVKGGETQAKDASSGQL